MPVQTRQVWWWPLWLIEQDGSGYDTFSGKGTGDIVIDETGEPVAVTVREADEVGAFLPQPPPEVPFEMTPDELRLLAERCKMRFDDGSPESKWIVAIANKVIERSEMHDVCVGPSMLLRRPTPERYC